MDMVVNLYGQKYAERSYGYKYLLHKQVPNPLKFRRSMSGLENRALTRYESEVTPLRINIPPYKSWSCERRRDHISIAIPTPRLVFRYE